ncbi:OmpP1/FadL family transporter [Acanthopleuribacter pedis]|uniref:Outer membrane protein transport protein n=1 Tax=Acanthopleuribacter pedis TaxID=442870 RepID=A0A8J7U5T9_9BACT|nr:outer membrane protein transport protein [Acanthopleuribacter pedis]MBO1319656.1 outer membrane protein transport protein [Acanthopleuribacter pedis]
MSVYRSWRAPLFCFLLAGCLPVFGAGFALYQGSARGNAQGGLPAAGDDASAIFYNPAGITNLEGTHFMAGMTLITPSADLSLTNTYTGRVTTAEPQDDFFIPPHVYYSRPIDDNLWLGIGVFSRFGLGSEFEDDFAGRYNSIDANIETIEFNPNIAWKVNDQISLAAGVRIMYLDVLLEGTVDASPLLGIDERNNPETTTYDVNQRVTGDALGYGFNFGLFYRMNQQWSFGVSYYSEVKQEVDNGAVKFKKPAGLPDTLFLDSPGTAELDLPAMAFFGASYKPSEAWSLTFGAVYTGWESFDEIRLEFDRPIIIIPGLGVGVTETVSPENWQDSWKYNIGAEFRVTDAIWVQTGFVYDDSPLREETIDYRLPTNDRTLINLGTTFNTGEWTISLAVNYLTIKDRDLPDQQLADGVLPSTVRNGGAILTAFSIGRQF